MGSCHSQNEKIAGNWKVSFDDSAAYTSQILHFKNDGSRLSLIIDEPWDGTLEMPGEKVSFANSKLHFESLWGLFKYDGELEPGDSVMRGIRLVNNGYPSRFIMKRIPEKTLSYRIPRVDTRGERVYDYSYQKPLQTDDGLECAALSEVGIDSSYIYKLIKDILSGKMSTIHSLLIVKDNKLILEEYFHNYNRNTLHNLESVTKSFTSALMGIAIDKKFIPDVNEAVWPYFKKWNSTKWVKEKYDVRVKHLLTMSSGLAWKPFTPNEYNDDANIFMAPDYIGYVLGKDLRYKPGEKFFYNNRIMFLQGQLIETTSGVSVDSFATRYLFDELGTKYHKWKIYDNGITETGGGLKLLPRDMVKFGILYLNRGKWQGKQIISTQWIEASSKSQIFAGNEDYGYNWWIKTYTTNHSNFNVYYASGHGEQTIMVIPEANIVFVMTAGNFFQRPQRLNEIMTGYILPALKTNAKAEQIFSGMTMQDLVGDYEINKGESIRIEITNNALFATDPSGAKLKLIQKSPVYYMVENSPKEIKFVIDESGKIVAGEVFINGNRVERLKKIN